MGHTAAPSSRAHLLQSDRPVLLRRKLLLQAGHLLLQLHCSRAFLPLLRLGCSAALVLFPEGLVLAKKVGQRSLAALQPASQLTQLLQRGGCTGWAAERLLQGGRAHSVCRLLPGGPASCRVESRWGVEQCCCSPWVHPCRALCSWQSLLLWRHVPTLHVCSSADLPHAQQKERRCFRRQLAGLATTHSPTAGITALDAINRDEDNSDIFQLR